MNYGAAQYSATADELTRRIADLIPSNPQIMDAGFDVWNLFEVPGFKCDDLEPSLFQASWALKKARELATAVTVSPTSTGPCSTPGAP